MSGRMFRSQASGSASASGEALAPKQSVIPGMFYRRQTRASLTHVEISGAAVEVRTTLSAFD